MLNERTKITLKKARFSDANAIVIIECLGAGDMKTGRRREEAIIDRLLVNDPEHIDENKKWVKHYTCASLAELRQAFSELLSLCVQGVQPFLFIDGHGDADQGLQLPSNEFMGWVEYLWHLGSITRETGGHLTVFAGFCCSYVATKHVSIEVKPPFAFYYGFETNVSTRVVEEEANEVCQFILGAGGKDFPVRRAKGYSEYDHVEPSLALVLMLAGAPKTLGELLPEFSQGALTRRVERDLAKHGVPLSGMTRAIKGLLSSSNLAFRLLETIMYDTERRQHYLNDIRILYGNPIQPKYPE